MGLRSIIPLAFSPQGRIRFVLPRPDLSDTHDMINAGVSYTVVYLKLCHLLLSICVYWRVWSFDSTFKQRIHQLPLTQPEPGEQLAHQRS